MSVITSLAPARIASGGIASGGAVAPERAPGRRGAELRPPLRLVEAPSTVRRVRVGVVGSILFGLVLIGVFALAAMHTLVVQAQFELDRIEQDMVDRQGSVDSLRLQVATLESPAHVANAARELGMVTPVERIHLEPVVVENSVRTEPSVDHS